MSLKFVPKIGWHSFFEVALDSAEASTHNRRARSKHKNVVSGIYQLKTILIVLQKSNQNPRSAIFNCLQLATCCHSDRESTTTIPYRGLKYTFDTFQVG